MVAVLKPKSSKQFGDRLAIVANFEGAAIGGDELLIQGQSHGSSDGRIEVWWLNTVFINRLSNLVGFSIDRTALNARSAEQPRESTGMMVAACIFIDDGCPSELESSRRP
jgi:hypothetical protein